MADKSIGRLEWRLFGSMNTVNRKVQRHVVSLRATFHESVFQSYTKHDDDLIRVIDSICWPVFVDEVY